MIGGACMNGAFGQKAYTLDECIQAALTNNVRMKNATNELEMAKQDKKKAFTNYFPSVSAAGTGFMADKGLMQMSLGPDMNMSMLKNGIAGGVGASLPLFTGGQIVNGNQLADQGELLVIRMKNAWNGVNEAYEQMKIARLSIEQSTENLRLNTDYYKAGTCTMSDLLDAQTLFQQSCDKYVESYTDYELKKREYLQVTGRR